MKIIELLKELFEYGSLFVGGLSAVFSVYFIVYIAKEINLLFLLLIPFYAKFLIDIGKEINIRAKTK